MAAAYNGIMPPEIKLQKDANGNVLTKPLTGWGVMPVAEIVVLLAIQYAETPEELETGRTHQIQFVLKPQECLGLAEALTKQAKRLLEDRSGRPSQ